MMQVRHLYIWIIIPLNHEMILLSCEISGHASVSMIHSLEGVHVVRLGWMDYFLNSIAWFFFLLRSVLT
jgi:hypothetical protein